MSSNQNTEPERNIIEFFNIKTFVKIKPAFNIGKIVFCFVEMNPTTKAAVTPIDCYMDIEDAALLAKKITTGRMYQLIEKERAKGEQYPAAIWQSTLGGVSEEKAKIKGLRTDGRAVSRYFTISPGSSKYAVITAITCAGDTNEKGLIVPDAKDKNKKAVRVAMASHDELEKLGIMLEAAVNAYMCCYVCGARKQTVN